MKKLTVQFKMYLTAWNLSSHWNKTTNKIQNRWLRLFVASERKKRHTICRVPEIPNSFSVGHSIGISLFFFLFILWMIALKMLCLISCVSDWKSAEMNDKKWTKKKGTKQTAHNHMPYVGGAPIEHAFSRELCLFITLSWNIVTHQNDAFYYLSIAIVNCIEYVWIRVRIDKVIQISF